MQTVLHRAMYWLALGGALVSAGFASGIAAAWASVPRKEASS